MTVKSAAEKRDLGVGLLAHYRRLPTVQPANQQNRYYVMQQFEVTVIYRDGTILTQSFEDAHKGELFFDKYMNMTPERGKPLSSIAKVIRHGNMQDWMEPPFK